MPIIRQTAENEYKKNPDIKKEDIAELKAWTLEQLHLPDISEFELILFYHSCYLDMENTRICIEKYYTMRTKQKLYFANRDPYDKTAISTLQKMLFAMLETRSKEGYKIFYIRFLDTEPSHFFYDEVSKVFSLVLDLIQVEEGTYPGLLILADLEGVPFGMLARLGLISLHNTFSYLQEALPVRLKGFHILNSPSYMVKFLNFLKPFLKKEILDLAHLHPAPIDTIYDFVPKEAFPRDLGGEFHSIEKIKNDVIEKIKDNADYYTKEELTKRVDESKRPQSAMSRFFHKIW